MPCPKSASVPPQKEVKFTVCPEVSHLLMNTSSALKALALEGWKDPLTPGKVLDSEEPVKYTDVPVLLSVIALPRSSSIFPKKSDQRTVPPGFIFITKASVAWSDFFGN